MTALTDELDRRLHADVAAGLLAAADSIESDDATMRAVELAQPLVISALGDWVIDAGSEFVSFLMSIDTVDDRLAAENEPARRVFGKRLLPASIAVAVEGGIAEQSAASILDAVSVHALEAVARWAQQQGGARREDLVDLLRAERSALAESGWGHWIDMVGRGERLAEPNTVSTPRNTTGGTAVGPTSAAAGHDEMRAQGDAITSSSEQWTTDPLTDSSTELATPDPIGSVSGPWSDPASSDPEWSDPASSDPEWSDPASSDPEWSAPVPSDPKPAEPSSAEGSWAEPSLAEGSWAEPTFGDAMPTDPADADDSVAEDELAIDAARLLAARAGSAGIDGISGGDDGGDLADEGDPGDEGEADARASGLGIEAIDAILDAGRRRLRAYTLASPSSGDEAPRRRRLAVVGALALIVIVGFGLFTILGSDDNADTEGGTSDEDIAGGDDGADSGGDDASGSSSDTGGIDVDEAGDTVDIATGEVVRFDVSLDDGAESAGGASGTADLAFNSETGQICYTFQAEGLNSPFAGHLHVGVSGEAGGIVVDFGEVTLGEEVCVTNPAEDTKDIIASPAGHYADIHDVGGELAIRGQLSDDEPDTEELPELAFVDPDGGGAEAVIESGRIVLRGPVVDRPTADLLVAEYAAIGVAGVDVVDELEVVAEAPSPSGRVVLRDAIAFPSGSADLGAADQGVIEVLVAVALSEADSNMTIVGHTDSVGDEIDNLELSLRRANALRDVLVAAGVPTANLRVVGAGDTDPIGDNATDAGRALNRRIEFELKPNVR